MRRLWEMNTEDAGLDLLEKLKSKVPKSYIVPAMRTNMGVSRSLRILSDGETGGGEEVPFRSEVLIADLFTPRGKAGDLLMWESWYKKLKKYLPKHEVNGKLHGQRLKIYFTGVEESDASFSDPVQILGGAEMKKLIDRNMGKVEEARTGSFAKTAATFSERVKNAANSAKFVKGQIAVMSGKWGMDAMDIQELGGHLKKAEESLRDAGVILDTFEDLLK